MQVMRGANCWSDHHMVRTKVTIHFPRVEKLPTNAIPIAVHALQGAVCREAYQQKVVKCLTNQPHTCSSDKSAEDNWSTLRGCVISAAEATVGRGRRKQPEWFLDAADTLQPVIDEKNATYTRYVQMNTVAAKKEFRRHQRVVKQAIDAAKEEWICRVSDDAEKAKKDGRQMDMCAKATDGIPGTQTTKTYCTFKGGWGIDNKLRGGETQHFNNVPSVFCQEAN